MHVFSGQSPALQVAYFSWTYWVVGTLLPLVQSAPTEFCPNTNEWRALPPSSNDEVAAITLLENSNKHLRKHKHLGKNQIKSLYSVMQGCSACVAGFLATWFMLCCCKMPISLYCCIKVLSIEHIITMPRIQRPMSCSYLLHTGGGFQFLNPNACQDSWGCGKSKPRIFICIQLYLLSQLEVLETRRALLSLRVSLSRPLLSLAPLIVIKGTIVYK